MAKIKTRPARQIKSKEFGEKFQFPLGRTNYLILAMGVLIIILGYVFMAIPDNPDDFLTRTLAPVLLVFSFVIVIPFGLLYKNKD